MWERRQERLRSELKEMLLATADGTFYLGLKAQSQLKA